VHRLCRGLGITARKDGSMATALEITRFFRDMTPADPVRYDFALTRLGMAANGRKNGEAALPPCGK